MDISVINSLEMRGSKKIKRERTGLPYVTSSSSDNFNPFSVE